MGARGYATSEITAQPMAAQTATKNASAHSSKAAVLNLPASSCILSAGSSHHLRPSRIAAAKGSLVMES